VQDGVILAGRRRSDVGVDVPEHFGGAGYRFGLEAELFDDFNMFRDPAERQRAIGRWGGTSGIGVALGPIIGGFLLARFWWGSVFLINVPIAVAGLLGACWLVPDSRNPAAKAPDLAGAGLSMAGIGVILWSIIEAPARGWSSPLVIGAGAGGLAVLALFAVWERSTSHPMLDLGFFRRRSFSAAIPAVVTLTFGLFGALFVLTQFLQLSLGFTALQAGIRLLPVAAAVIVVAPASAISVRAIGPKFSAPGPGWRCRRRPAPWSARCPRPTAASPPPPTPRLSSSAARSAWRSSAACWLPATRTG
jgi:MFS family permease